MTSPSQSHPHALLDRILRSALGDGSLPPTLDTDTPLLGAIPELDSMGLLAILTAIEQEFGVPIDDEDVDASVFESFGSLERFVHAQIAKQ